MFDEVSQPNGWEALVGSLAYTFQLYFDFSGYCDIANGCSWILGLELPFNFFSPYKAISIRDFWRRWHITLGNFLREHIYIPLGGNRRGLQLQLLALFLTFFLGGIWHGAGRTFIIWGALHGFYTCTQTLYEHFKLKPLPNWLSGALTFTAVHCAWIFFRAASVSDALKFFSVRNLNALTLPHMIQKRLPIALKEIFEGVRFLPQIQSQIHELLLVLCTTVLLTWIAPNSHQIAEKI